jgi:hypothetical protein
MIQQSQEYYTYAVCVIVASCHSNVNHFARKDYGRRLGRFSRQVGPTHTA